LEKEPDKKQVANKTKFGILIIIVIILCFQFCNLFNSLKAYEEKITINLEEIELNSNKLNDSTSTLELINLKIQQLRNKSKYELHDPAYEEVTSFLINDTTNNNSYHDTNYNCAHYSRDVNNNAEELGIRCAYVVLEINTGIPHALIAFNTTDDGLVFFEPQTDEIVLLEVGKDYWIDCVVSEEDYESGNIIEKITVYW